MAPQRRSTAASSPLRSLASERPFCHRFDVKAELLSLACTCGRARYPKIRTAVQPRNRRSGRPSRHGIGATSDRRLRRRRLLDGVREPAARRLRARPDQGRAAARLLPALGQRRRRPLHRPLLPRLLRPPLRGQPHLALPPRAGPGGPAPPPALPGPDLRRRRQRRQPARRLAGARDRRDPARSWEAGVDPLRPLGRLALLVRRGGHRLPRRPANGSTGSACCRSATASTTSRGSERRASYHGFLREGMRAGLRGRGRRRPALHRHRAEPGGRLAAGGARLPARRRRAAGGRDADRHHLPRRTPAATPLRRRSPPEAMLHRPWRRRFAAATTISPHPRPRRPRLHLAPARPRRLRAAAAAGDRARRRAAADLHPADRQRRHLRADRRASTRPSASAPASPPTSPSSGSAAGRWRCATTCSPRT